MCRVWETMGGAVMTRGRSGEERAARHLIAQEYEILERNFRCRLGEIDIIAHRDDVLVFCEVKSRFNRSFGEPFEAVTLRKQMRLRRLADFYRVTASSRLPPYGQIRFDVISVLLGDVARIEHIENAF